MRLIDADALKDWECEKCEYEHKDGYWCRESCGVMQRIDESPTIDAVPVVRGKWENVHTISAGLFLRNCEDFAESKCSVCGRWTVRLARCIRANYCPHCGADMRGEKDGTD